MVLVALLTPVVVLGALFWVLTTVTIWQAQVTLVIALGVGICVVRATGSRSPRAAGASRRRRAQLHAIVERLCVVADLAKPTIVLERRALPNSWVEGTVRGGYRLHLTQGLLDLLEPSELEAVIAHELAHVINRDAAVMTVVGGPGEALLQGGARMTGQGWPLMLGGAVARRDRLDGHARHARAVALPGVRRRRRSRGPDRESGGAGGGADEGLRRPGGDAEGRPARGGRARRVPSAADRAEERRFGLRPRTRRCGHGSSGSSASNGTCSSTNLEGVSGTRTRDPLRARLSELTLQDEYRLGRRLQRLKRGDEQGRERLERDIARAEERIVRRRAAVPAVTYPEALPVSARGARTCWPRSATTRS